MVWDGKGQLANMPDGSAAETDNATGVVPAIEGSDAEPRGALRPARLLSSRQRQDTRLAGHRFRFMDTVFLICAGILLLQQFAATSVLQMPLVDVIPVAAEIWMIWIMAGGLGLYRFSRSERVGSHFGRIGIATALGVGVGFVLQALLPAQQASVVVVLLVGTLCGVGLAALHAIWWLNVARWRKKGLLTPNVVVVGATDHAEQLIAGVIDRRDMNILGVFDDRTDRSPFAILGVPVLGTTNAMLEHRLMPYIDLIVVAIDPSAYVRVREITRRISVLPNTITLLFDEENEMRRARAIDQIAEAPLASLHRENDSARKAFVKRTLDLLIGTIALILFSPLMILIGLAIKLDSKGPVFFRQSREGFNNEEISVWKFRSMSHASADPHATQQVTANDARVTRVGRILRSTSLDELPQLFNVIRGEMSLVGPRPHAIGMKTGDVDSAALVAEYAHRHRIKPGMTGWAAIHGSRGPMHDPEAVSRRVALDVEYIEHQSVWLDLLIMLRTVPSLLGDRKAIR